MRIYKVHFSYTNMKFNVVLSISIGLVLLPRISKQEKPSDCIHLKQYWSTHFDESGSCILCPRSFEICSGQGEDRKSCEGSCFGKSGNLKVYTASLSVQKYTYPLYAFNNVI
jgi:hypothetical protein